MDMVCFTCADRGGGGGRWSGSRGPDPFESHKNIGFHNNTGPDSLINHKTTNPVFNVGPPSAHFRVDDGLSNGVSLANR